MRTGQQTRNFELFDGIAQFTSRPQDTILGEPLLQLLIGPEMVTTRLDGGVDSRSDFIDVAEWVTGLREASGEIGHDQHPLGVGA